MTARVIPTIRRSGSQRRFAHVKRETKAYAKIHVQTNTIDYKRKWLTNSSGPTGSGARISATRGVQAKSDVWGVTCKSTSRTSPNCHLSKMMALRRLSVAACFELLNRSHEPTVRTFRGTPMAATSGALHQSVLAGLAALSTLADEEPEAQALLVLCGWTTSHTELIRWRASSARSSK
jgi:hypothetical protein